MKRMNSETNDKLAKVVENYQRHIKATSTEPVVMQIINDVIDIDLYEMWMLTQM